MKSLLCTLFGLFCAAVAPAQTVTVTGPGTLTAGANTFQVNYVAGGTGAAPVALQWTLQVPLGNTVTSTVIGAAGTAAGKTLTCGPTGLTCVLLSAANSTPIGAGVLATVTMNVTVLATTNTYALTNVFGATLGGDSSNTLAGPAVNIPGTSVPVVVAVAVTPLTATIQTGTTQQFTASVTGTTNTAVTWAVNGVVGGNATVGTISTSGLYTAPAVAPSGTVTIKATSTADTTKSASATVTLSLPPISIVICDANRDGKVDAIDVSYITGIIVGSITMVPGTVPDQDGNGVVDVRDAMIVATKVLGGTCWGR